MAPTPIHVKCLSLRMLWRVTLQLVGIRVLSAGNLAWLFRHLAQNWGTSPNATKMVGVMVFSLLQYDIIRHPSIHWFKNFGPDPMGSPKGYTRKNTTFKGQPWASSSVRNREVHSVRWQGLNRGLKLASLDVSSKLGNPWKPSRMNKH